MARNFAQFTTSIWRPEDDFRDLSVSAQLTYFLLASQPDISAAGVLPIRIRWWASCTKDRTPEDVVASLNELSAAGKVVIDKVTEELLVRSFIRSDKGYGNTKRTPVIRAAARAVLSTVLRDAIVVEMLRLGLTGMANEVVPGSAPDTPVDNNGDTVSTPEITGPDTSPDRLSGRPPDTVPEGISASERVVVTNVSSSSPQPTTLEPGTAPTSPAPSPRPSEFCETHPAGTDRPCVPCGRARASAETWDLEQADLAKTTRLAERAARREATLACDRCDPDGWALDHDGAPTTSKCQHPTPNT